MDLSNDEKPWLVRCAGRDLQQVGIVPKSLDNHEVNTVFPWLTLLLSGSNSKSIEF
jgi:hypothetical protein